MNIFFIDIFIRFLTISVLKLKVTTFLQNAEIICSVFTLC